MVQIGPAVFSVCATAKNHEVVQIGPFVPQPVNKLFTVSEIGFSPRFKNSKKKFNKTYGSRMIKINF